ncbi:hypothetical protein B0H21DRAFT_165904 [Amylocystis lapponica]|nr:hypothetical protein B0H21DRAFT_165904 [Amylocystis lapponica]
MASHIASNLVIALVRGVMLRELSKRLLKLEDLELSGTSTLMRHTIVTLSLPWSLKICDRNAIAENLGPLLPLLVRYSIVFVSSGCFPRAFLCSHRLHCRPRGSAAFRPGYVWTCRLLNGSSSHDAKPLTDPVVFSSCSPGSGSCFWSGIISHGTRTLQNELDC